MTCLCGLHVYMAIVLHSIFLSAPFWRSSTCREVLTRSRYSNKADVWSYGCILSELMALKPPFSEYQEYDIHDAVVHRREIPDIPLPTVLPRARAHLLSLLLCMCLIDTLFASYPTGSTHFSPLSILDQKCIELVAISYRRVDRLFGFFQSDFEARMGELIKLCCKFESNHRPTFSQVLNTFKQLEQSGATAVPLLPIQRAKDKVGLLA